MISSIPDEGSFPVNQGFKNMQIHPSGRHDVSTSAIPGAYPNGSGTTGLKREDSRVALQRRSHVLSQAAEDGKPPVEPSWEMVAAATAQDQVAGSSNINKGQNKRVHSELTPLSEEASMDNGADGSSPLSEVEIHKRGKSSDEEDQLKVEGMDKPTRGKGRAGGPANASRSARARAGKSNESEEESAQPRRSGRHPKAARRG
jgi:serine/threonine/tyrosine protein kinase RAD53